MKSQIYFTSHLYYQCKITKKSQNSYVLSVIYCRHAIKCSSFIPNALCGPAYQQTALVEVDGGHQQVAGAHS